MLCRILVSVFLSASICWSSGLAANTSVKLYLGNGCFFARQHLFIEEFERKVLNRTDRELTAVNGYGGSTKTGPHGSACYHNAQDFADYGTLGRAEVVQLEVPFESLDKVFAVFFDSFVDSFQPGQWTRPDYYDVGAEYRSLLGVPGGIDNADVLEAMRRSNVHNMTLRAGHGSDPDTFSNNTVLVMDSQKFPFIQAERCLQFHDDSQAKYSASYHALLKVFESEGRVVSTNCPPNYICNSTVGFTAIV